MEEGKEVISIVGFFEGGLFEGIKIVGNVNVARSFFLPSLVLVTRFWSKVKCDQR